MANSMHISSPPIDGEGKTLTRLPNGSYVPRTRTGVSPEVLAQLTNSGQDTRALLEANNLEDLINNSANPEQARAAIENMFPGGIESGVPSFPGSNLTTQVITTGGQDDGGSQGGGSQGSGDPALNAGITPDSKMLGQQLWNIKVTFYNHMQRYELAPHTIKLLEIEEDFLSWPTRGSIVVDNRMEGFERSFSDKFYHVRGDARDEIFIDVWPTTKDGDMQPEKIWRIKFHGVIYDTEDLPHEDMTTKVKKFYFWDKKFQIMQEKVLEWSTSTGPRRGWFKNPDYPPEPIAHATDEERAMYTGDAIASLLIAAGYEDYISKDDWDPGAGKILFNTKSSMTVQDCLDYVARFHISNDGYDECSVEWDRGEEKFALIPRWKYYEEAGKNEPGKLQREHLFFENRSDNTDGAQSVSPFKAPYVEDASTEIDIKSADYNTILSYRFSQSAGLDNAKAYITKPVYSHWHKGKQFQVDVKENEIQTVKQYFKTHYVEKLLGNDYPVMCLNRTKTEEYAIVPAFSPVSTLDPIEDRIVRGSEGRGKILFGGVYLNQTLAVRLKGSTHRIAGTFIGVDRLTEDSDTNYDYQVCGQYFVTKVKHIIHHQKYVNDVVMVKVHAYDALKNEEDIY